MLTRCRVVLVRTHYAGNLGATARVMRNFGLVELVLVDPICSSNDLEARRMATHGLPVLDAARIVPDLGEALGDCVFTLATSGLSNGVVRQSVVGTPREKLPVLLDAAGAGPVALVFGPEPHGLTTAEISRCHGLIHIPVDPSFPALNLAQAVAICCYELHELSRTRTERLPASVASAVAPFTDQERAYEHLREALTAVGFLFGSRADSLMHAVRQLLGRAQPSVQEVRILHGLARQLLFVAGRRDHSGAPSPGIPGPEE